MMHDIPTWLVWLSAVILMGAVTFLLRAAPVLLPESWLRSQLLAALNNALPLSIMTLLVLAGLTFPGKDTGLLHTLAEVLSLAAVLFSYQRWRNVLLSMVVGVAMLNLWLYLFQAA